MALVDNLVAYWKLDESSGNAYDSSGNGFTLTNTNVSYTSGKINNCGDFNGSSSKLVISNDLGIGGGAITLNAWIKIDTYNNGAFISQMDATTKVQYNIRGKKLGGNGLYFSRVKRGVADNSVEVANSTSDWQMITLTYDNTNVKAYINGEYQNQTASSGNGSATVSDISALGYQLETSDFIDGKIDEAGVWSRALSSDEITALYNGGSGLTYPFTNIKSVNSLYKRSIKTT